MSTTKSISSHVLFRFDIHELVIEAELGLELVDEADEESDLGVIGSPVVDCCDERFVVAPTNEAFATDGLRVCSAKVIQPHHRYHPFQSHDIQSSYFVVREKEVLVETAKDRTCTGRFADRPCCVGEWYLKWSLVPHCVNLGNQDRPSIPGRQQVGPPLKLVPPQGGDGRHSVHARRGQGSNGKRQMPPSGEQDSPVEG